MRDESRVVAGQLWRSSDPRRLSAFRVLNNHGGVVLVNPVYPVGRRRALDADAFKITGSKGYTLMEDAR